MGQAMDMMSELNDLEALENMLRGTTNPGALAEVDIERARELMGNDVANSLEQMSELSKMLEDSGLIFFIQKRLITLINTSFYNYTCTC